MRTIFYFSISSTKLTLFKQTIHQNSQTCFKIVALSIHQQTIIQSFCKHSLMSVFKTISLSKTPKALLMNIYIYETCNNKVQFLTYFNNYLIKSLYKLEHEFINHKHIY